MQRRQFLLSFLATSLTVPTMATAAQPMTDAQKLEWVYLADTVMGGVSEGTGQFVEGGVRLTGQVSTANNGGFIQLRTNVNGLPGDSLTLRVRGNGEDYFVHLRTRSTRLPWQYYQARFPTTNDWSDVTLPLSDFAPSGGMLPRVPDAASIRSIGLVAYGRDHAADVSLAALGPV